MGAKGGVQPRTWANRLALVRGFARYRSATDARTEAYGPTVEVGDRRTGLQKNGAV
jgi:hypothetical protein